MPKQMRRANQQLSNETCIEVMIKNTSGVLAVCDQDKSAYAVPLSYVYHDHKIYFHSALQGHKIDAIKANENVSFCIIDQDKVIAEKYTTHYRSVIVFGKARIVESEEEKEKSILLLCEKYSPEVDKEEMKQEIAKSMAALCMIAIDITHVSGKQAKELG